MSIGSYNLKLKEKSRANEEEMRADLIAYTTHEEADESARCRWGRSRWIDVTRYVLPWLPIICAARKVASAAVDTLIHIVDDDRNFSAIRDFLH